MTSRILALFGFARSETQATRAPLFAYLGLLMACYFAAHIVDWLASLLGPSVSIYLRTVGLFTTMLVAHGLYRIIVHQDDNSWGGYIRKQLIG